MNFNDRLNDYINKYYPNLQQEVLKEGPPFNPKVLAFAAPISDFETYGRCMERKKDSKDKIDELLENSFGYECPIELLNARSVATFRWALLSPEEDFDKNIKKFEKAEEYKQCCQKLINEELKPSVISHKTPTIHLHKCFHLEKESNFGLNADEMGTLLLTTRYFYQNLWERREYRPCYHLIEKFKNVKTSFEEDQELNNCLIQNTKEFRKSIDDIEKCWEENSNQPQKCKNVVKEGMMNTHLFRIEKFQKLMKHL